MNRKLLIIMGIFLLLTSLVGGCQSSAKKPMREQNNDRMNSNEMTAGERRVLANKLSQAAESIEGVKRSAVVISSAQPATGRQLGNNPNDNMMNPRNENMLADDNEMSQVENGIVAMVGLTVDSNISNDINKINRTKELVQQKLKATDKRVAQVLVTTDPNLMKRIDDMAARIVEGKPVKSFEKDLRDLNDKLKK
mgnify:CR=1 FL=1